MMCFVAISEADEAALEAKFAVMRQILNERQWRVYLGTEARALGTGDRGGGAGLQTRPRPRWPAGTEPGLRQELLGLLEDGTRGAPVSPLPWSVLSLREIERMLAAKCFRAGKDAVARIWPVVPLKFGYGPDLAR
jgi:hypothetical protein